MRRRKAIILAAGAGSRLSLGGPGTPKPLLPLSGIPGTTTLLDRHVECLSAAGVAEILIVGNAITFDSPVAAAAARVTWILNAASKTGETGSGHSAWIAFTSPHGVLDGDSDVLLMDADIAYGRELLPALFASADSESSLIAVTTETAPYDDAVLVYVDQAGLPRRQGKRLAGTPHVDGLRYAGVATGILVWRPRDHVALADVADYAMHRSDTRTRTEHEELTQRMMELGRMRLAEIPPECPFIEVDTPADYSELTTRVAPQLT